MLFLRFEFAKTICFVLFILWIYLLSAVESKHVNKRGIMENINNGIKYAGQMLGINTAADVASLVAKAFAPQNTNPTKKIDASDILHIPYNDRNHDSNSSKINPTEMIGGILRLIGFDAGKLGALAINAIFMIAQLIGNTLTKRQSPKSSEEKRNFNAQYPYENEEQTFENQQDNRSGREYVNDGSPLDWILDHPPEGLAKLIEQIGDRQLPNKIADDVEKLENQSGQGECIKLLLCKSAPFIWGMQKSIANRFNDGSKEADENVEKSKPISIMFRNLPNIEEYRRHGHLCERRYSDLCKRSQF